MADYPFTTVEPVLGTVEADDGRQLTVADVPGLLEGASQGVGLGHEFLAHLERARLLIHLVEAGGDAEELARRRAAIDRELRLHGGGLAERPQLVVLSKIDLVDAGRAGGLVAAAGAELACSSATGEGIDELCTALFAAARGRGRRSPRPSRSWPTTSSTGRRPPARRRFRILRDAGTLRVAGRELERAVGGLDPATATTWRRSPPSSSGSASSRRCAPPAPAPATTSWSARTGSRSSPRSERMTRIGIFGGQFDPPHNGHLAVVRAARSSSGSTACWSCRRPAAAPAAPATPAGMRFRLARAAFAGEPGVEVSRIELDRDGPGYTADTLERCRPRPRALPDHRRRPVRRPRRWHRPERIRELATLVVAARPGSPAAAGVPRGSGWSRSTRPPSELRRRIARGRGRPRDWCPPAVADAIAAGRLVRPAPVLR